MADIVGSLGGGSEDVTDGEDSTEEPVRSSRAKGGRRQGASGASGTRDRDPRGGGEVPSGAGAVVSDATHARVETATPHPERTPLFNAQQSDRYARQRLIAKYQEDYDCRLVVMIDFIFPECVTYLEELLYGADPTRDLHLLLDSPGGDGETAVRLVRMAQARCRELTIIVPNQAKSAGTILALGAHRILMGPTSDLGPVDPQFQDPSGRGRLYAAKDLIAAVDAAERAIARNPESYALHAALLANVNAVMVQQARSALARTTDLVREALRAQPDRKPAQVRRIAQSLKRTLIDLPRNHGAVFGATDAAEVGLPIDVADPDCEQWKLIWHLWTKYFALKALVYEGAVASQLFPR